MNRLAVIGAGSWGTALAIALSTRFEEVVLWTRQTADAERMAAVRRNMKYLPEFLLPPNVVPSGDVGGALQGADMVLVVVPSRYLRSVCNVMRTHVGPNTIVVSATKGIENETLLRMSGVLADVLGPSVSERVAVLSGPTFAKEVAAGEPAAVVVASSRSDVAAQVQRAFVTPKLRFYTSDDAVGVELGAAIKNVIAIGAGICRGLGLGSNTVAALITRGLAEVTRLAVREGGQPRTLAGLAGLGDLVLTATGDLSRNRFVGLQLATGKPLHEVLGQMSQVAEGVETSRAVHLLSKLRGIDMPICEAMHEVLHRGKPVQQAIRDLMERPPTSEW